MSYFDVYAWITFIRMQTCLLSDCITSGNRELLFRSHNAIDLRRGQERVSELLSETVHLNPKRFEALTGWFFITEAESVHSAVRTGSLNQIRYKIILQMLLRVSSRVLSSALALLLLFVLNSSTVQQQQQQQQRKSRRRTPDDTCRHLLKNVL